MTIKSNNTKEKKITANRGRRGYFDKDQMIADYKTGAYGNSAGLDRLGIKHNVSTTVVRKVITGIEQTNEPLLESILQKCSLIKLNKI